MKKERASRQLLTLREVGVRLRRSLSSLKSDMRLGHLESVKIGHSRRVPIESVERMILAGGARKQEGEGQRPARDQR